MTDTGLNFLLAQASPQQGPPSFWNLMPMILMVVVFYFILIRPQQKKAKELAEQIKSLKKGDKVLTNGGIIGVIVSVREKSATIRSDESKFEILKSSVAEITERGSSAETKEA